MARSKLAASVMPAQNGALEAPTTGVCADTGPAAIARTVIRAGRR
jgi:hypothetical protein